MMEAVLMIRRGMLGMALLGLFGVSGCAAVHAQSSPALPGVAAPLVAPAAANAGAPSQPASESSASSAGPADLSPVLSGTFGGTSAASNDAAPPPAVQASSLAASGSGPNVWAVVIGIQNYDAPTHHTYSGDGDTVAFRNLLHRAGWPDDHVLQLVDGAATLGNIRAAMQWLVNHSSPSSFTLFHFSGHVCISSAGGCPSGHTFLWSVDNGFISENEFGQVMRGLQGHAWVDISGCESAAFDQGISSPLRLYTAASEPHEKGYEIPSWHESTWTGVAVDQGILQSMGDTDHDGQVSLQESVAWAQGQVAAMTRNQQPYGPQHPYAAGGSGDWSLNAASPTSPPSPPPAPAGAPAPQPKSTKPKSSPPTTNKCGSVTFGLWTC
jgi:hypothetical protein